MPQVRQGLGEAAPILGSALMMVDRSENQVNDALEQLRNHSDGKGFATEVRSDPSLKDAPSRNVDIFRYAPESQGAEDYNRLIDEIEERLRRYGSVYDTLKARTAPSTASEPTTS